MPRGGDAGRVPENALLRHDLFEGVFARDGLVTDVTLLDGTRRVPRQRLAPTPLGSGRLAVASMIVGRRAPAPSPAVVAVSAASPDGRSSTTSTNDVRPSRNRRARRHLDMSRASAGWSTAFVVASFIVPTALAVAAGVLPRRSRICMRGRLHAVRSDVVVSAADVVLGVTFLAHQASLMVDAIVRTLARIVRHSATPARVETTAQVEAEHDLAFGGFFRQMAGGVMVAGVNALLAFSINADAVWIAAAFHRSVAGGAGRRPLGQLPAADQPRSDSPMATSRVPPARPADVAVLRDVRRAGRPLPSSGRLPG